MNPLGERSLTYCNYGSNYSNLIKKIYVTPLMLFYKNTKLIHYTLSVSHKMYGLKFYNTKFLGMISTFLDVSKYKLYYLYHLSFNLKCEQLILYSKTYTFTYEKLKVPLCLFTTHFLQ